MGSGLEMVEETQSVYERRLLWSSHCRIFLEQKKRLCPQNAWASEGYAVNT